MSELALKYNGNGEQVCVYVEERGGYVFVPARTLMPDDLAELEEQGVSADKIRRAASLVSAPPPAEGEQGEGEGEEGEEAPVDMYDLVDADDIEEDPGPIHDGGEGDEGGPDEQ